MPGLQTRDELVKNIAENLGVPQRVVRDVVEEMMDITKIHLQQKRKARTPFGTLEFYTMPARKGRNPKTGEEISVEARIKVRFKLSKHFLNLDSVTPE